MACLRYNYFLLFLRFLLAVPHINVNWLRALYLTADAQMKATWELSIMNLTSDIFTEAFFGTRVDQMAMYKCLKGSWGKGRFVVLVTQVLPFH